MAQRVPDWLHIQAPREALTGLRNVLGDGERQAIALAVEMGADALLMDDRDARREAEKMHCAVLGTLRVLADAGAHGHADLKTALDRLRLTIFRADDRLIQRILDGSEERMPFPADIVTPSAYGRNERTTSARASLRTQFFRERLGASRLRSLTLAAPRP